MRIGVMFDRDLAPEQLIPYARALDAMPRVDDLWVVEDLGWTGGLTSAATALAVTGRLRVGLGIAPAPLRNPALLAMELGNLARLHPGRLVAGIGHGVQDWMRQVGAAARSPLGLLEETIVAVGALLRGERVTLDGREVHLSDVALVHPPAAVPPIMAGVLGPRSLAASGRLAQGTIVPEGYGPALLAQALKHIAPAPDHEIVVLTNLMIGTLPDAIVQGTAGFLKIDPSEVFSVSGTAEQAAARLAELDRAGAHTVVLRPADHDDPLRHVSELLAALS
ncbi:LLM class flavin-dependent oxidoreductase [Nonomuraea soli]|uniref:Alkanesulfonate monooxygenase SsuD/methylene tetrahydromethanopterin reductase-like flavin-dependent oxidoreductase (Luciferase family) n=1 Tax=Nonomuraea soli TaxID=1032476 RepID=A0A7W0HR88_9ACTN|nr:LLM class flavin-dependent oxidoreductase [Nonomuraea soli]MBA2892597.1 alkanesulfonate monooxygenase SsuD/methylene tetrahydromethanopterin reductase-like flavin-dependent oxidoreductase (luciferase family) [Nonomuraea soli]